MLAQASSYPDFQLHTLGWKGFQDLCLCIARDVLGQTVQGFHPVGDAGQDGAFYGSWRTQSADLLTGSFTIQCKFSSKADTALSLSDLTDEIEKVRSLASKGLASNYILLTNRTLLGKTSSAITRAIESIEGVSKCLCYGPDWIVGAIRESARLRALVPRVYGLGDLSLILDERAIEQSTQVMRVLGDDLKKLVRTRVHEKAARALIEHGFVVLLGPPMAGKSTVAATLALAAADLWKTRTIIARSLDELLSHWNVHEPTFFWIDDVFGTTQLQLDYVEEWSRAVPQVNALLNSGSKIVITSRSHIFYGALRALKADRFPLINNSRVIVDAQDLTTEEREQILYNHVKLGNNSQQVKRAIKPFLTTLARLHDFSPELARRLGDSAFTRDLALTLPSLTSFMQQPVQQLQSVLTTLDRDSFAALALIFAHNGFLERPLDFTESDREICALLGSNFHAVFRALEAMENSLVRYRASEKIDGWVFRHPTVRDALASIFSADSEYLSLYLNGAPASTLVREVVCEGIDVEGASVVVPSSMHRILLGKLDQLSEDARLGFLSSRCDKSFLQFYMNEHPALFNKAVEARSRLDFDLAGLSTLIARCARLGILPEHVRSSVVTLITRAAIEETEITWWQEDIFQLLLTETERETIRDALREDFLGRLDRIIENWVEQWDGDRDPESYFEPLVEAITAIDDVIQLDPIERKIADRAISNITWETERLKEYWRGEERDDYFSYREYYPSSDNETRSVTRTENRSVFDDVDV